jgi:hypothetical protein
MLTSPLGLTPRGTIGALIGAQDFADVTGSQVLRPVRLAEAEPKELNVPGRPQRDSGSVDVDVDALRLAMLAHDAHTEYRHTEYRPVGRLPDKGVRAEEGK